MTTTRTMSRTAFVERTQHEIDRLIALRDGLLAAAHRYGQLVDCIRSLHPSERTRNAHDDLERQVDAQVIEFCINEQVRARNLAAARAQQARVLQRELVETAGLRDTGR